MNYLDGKVVLVTGGTGSFGWRFTDYILSNYDLKKLMIFSRDELKQHDMRQVYSDEGNSPVRYFIGDVRDSDRLRRAFDGVDVVIHAAALKQVPACEYNPFEAILTNVIGAKNVIDAAIDTGVKRVLALSSDKAVNPSNLYGATKLCSEKVFVQGNAYGARKTVFSCARYGNVVGSRGSVLPVFNKQKETGKITLTDERMTRFWISLEQGVEFIIGCIEKMEGGEIFIPKIPSMSLVDLARVVAPECEMQMVGIRPGEKIHEVLISEDEARHSVELDDSYVILPLHPWWESGKWKDAKKLPDGFRYASDSNPVWLSEDDLKALIG